MRLFTIGCMLVTFLLCGTCYANEQIFEADLFSIDIPKGMVIDDKDVNNISLIFEDDEYLLKGTLSVAATRAKVTDFESKWLKVRQLIVKDKQIINEGQDEFSGLKWKVIEVKGVRGQFKMKNIAYYATTNNVVYSMHFHCTVGNCTPIENSIPSIKRSFKVIK